MNALVKAADGACRVCFPAVVALLLAVGGAEAQEARDSSAVADVMFDMFLGSWASSAEETGEYEPPNHPLGEPVAFCIVFGMDPSLGGGPPPSPALDQAVRARMVESYSLDPGQGCEVRTDSLSGRAGVMDGRERPAVQVFVGVAFRSGDRAAGHVGFWRGGFFLSGFKCELERREQEGWAAVEDGCQYYES